MYIYICIYICAATLKKMEKPIRSLFGLIYHIIHIQYSIHIIIQTKHVFHGEVALEQSQAHIQQLKVHLAAELFA